MSKSALLRTTAAHVACGILLSSAGAFAQEVPADDGDVIIVTGSRISRPDLEASSPVTSLAGDQFKQSNSPSVEKLLAQNPQFVPAIAATVNNGNPGVATVDLRGLGDVRTLVLVNGKRQVSYDSQGVVDVNAIPVALIKRVDVLTGGASAVYGSDAVAGVVNFILDDRFTGLRADASSQITSRGDGAVYDLSLTGGLEFGGGRGNIVLSGGYTKRKTVFQGDRRYANPARFSDDLSPGGSSTTVPTAIDNTFDDSDTPYYQIGPGNDFVPYYQPYNYAPPNYLVVPQERYSATALLRYELTDGIEFFGRGNYLKSKVNSQSAPTGTFGYPFDIAPDNAYLTPQQRDLLFASPNSIINPDGSTTIGIRRRIVESGGRTTTYDNEAWQVVGGLRGQVSNLNWEVFAQYSKSKRDIAYLNDITYARTAQALDAVLGPNGIQCRDTSNGCVPLNLFTSNPIGPDALGFILTGGRQKDQTTQFVAGGSLAGDIDFLSSPWAENPVAFAVGVEYRRESARTAVDDAYASGDLIGYGQGFNLAPYHFDTKEIFGELRIPVVSDKPFFESLSLELGYRYSDYSTVGGVHAYKFGGDWSPVRGVRFRGLYQRAVRAPNIYELTAPPVSTIDNLSTDPCANGAPVGNATLTALCLGTGAPGSTYNVNNIPGPVAGQINAFGGGNLNLDAEKSDTYTIGVVLTPPQVPGLSISVDWFDITINNAIDALGGSPQNVVDGCYLVAQDLNSPYCQAITRNRQTGSLSGSIEFGVDQAQFNSAFIQTKGIDVGITYDHRVGSGNLNFSLNGTWLDTYAKQGAAFVPVVECAGKFGFSCNLAPIPEWKHVAALTYGLNGISLMGRWRYFGKVKQDVGTDILVSSIKAQNYFDATLSFDIEESLTFRIGVENMFDKQPPVVGSEAGSTTHNAANTFPTVYDALGRQFFAGVTAKF
ncbi:TonB-dependent receptor [Sphingobium sp. AN641]|uniref:TonB-dependent receptor domain-containing protein n=1 Tax=Sphingobium sp. AN641 TaxID=3133443 RepID=UPI0030BE1202